MQDVFPAAAATLGQDAANTAPLTLPFRSARPGESESVNRLCALAASLLEVPFVTIARAAGPTDLSQSYWVHGMAQHPAELAAIRALSQVALPGTAPMTVENIHDSPVFSSLAELRGSSLKAYAAMPLLITDGEVVGRLCAIDVEPRRWSMRELQVLSSVCGMAVLAIQLQDADLQQRAALAAEADRRSQRELMADIAHDLRQPLELVSLLGELLSMDDVQRLRQHGERLRKAVRTMTVLIGDLELPDEPASLMSAEATDAVPLVSALIQDLEPLAARQGLRFEVTSEADLPPIRCAPGRFLRVYANLLGNAIKFAAPSTVILVSSRRVAGGVQFSITNEGAGIPAADAVHVFERRWRGSPSGTGRGLGLAIARAIVDAQGGTIEVSSADQKTSFRFTMPLGRSVAAQTQPASRSA